MHSIYVVDDSNVLKGRLSLKDLLTSPNDAHIKDVYIPKVDYVGVHEKSEEVAKVMAKYDLEAIPVVDEMNRLVGRITIDDIVDVIREEADKDYQQMAGITQDVEADDSILDLTRARLPWLVVGLIGGLGAAMIMGGFEDIISEHAILFFFTPLIAAMAGNVGVQSSAIIVQESLMMISREVSLLDYRKKCYLPYLMGSSWPFYFLQVLGFGKAIYCLH